jgi:flagellar biosynthesis protein FlhA
LSPRWWAQASWPPAFPALPTTRNPAQLVEHVRARLARQLCAQHLSTAGYLPLIALSPKWEQTFAESIISHGE